MLKGLYLLDQCDRIYSKQVQNEISQLVDIVGPSQTKESLENDYSILENTEVLFGGWGTPSMDQYFLEAAPNLKAVFYAAGSVKKLVTDSFWQRGIVLTSAVAANAIPTAEYALGQVLFSLKRGWYHVKHVKESKEKADRGKMVGAYKSTVGIISLGHVGQHLARLLVSFDVNVIAYDPYFTPDLAKALDVKLVDLDYLFEKADVVSIHAPHLPETEGMITGKQLALMKENATFINTARGQIVKQEEMVDVLLKRPDLFAILDVTHPWKLKPKTKLYQLYDMDNVIITPHIAGSQANECYRLGDYMLDELNRFIKGEPLKYQVTKEQLTLLA